MSSMPPSMPGPAPGSAGTIEVDAGFVWLAFLLYLCRARVSIDGLVAKVPWGKVAFPVVAGRHHVEVWTSYLFYTEMGRNGVVVDVPPGGIVQIRWRAPWFAFSKGKISVVGAGMAPGAAPMAPSPAPAPYGGLSSHVVGQPAVGQPPAVMPAPGLADAAGHRPPIPGATAPGIGLGMGPGAPRAPHAPWPGGAVAPVAPAGWHADPAGRHQHRYFDGARWTDHVADNGVSGTDPMGA